MNCAFLCGFLFIKKLLVLQSMLGSVICARDRWLKPGGLILPSNATVRSSIISHPCKVRKKKKIISHPCILVLLLLAFNGWETQGFVYIFAVFLLGECTSITFERSYSSSFLMDLMLKFDLMQLYMAPVTHPDRYSNSIDFWRDVYGIDSEY